MEKKKNRNKPQWSSKINCLEPIQRKVLIDSIVS